MVRKFGGGPPEHPKALSYRDCASSLVVFFTEFLEDISASLITNLRSQQLSEPFMSEHV